MLTVREQELYWDKHSGVGFIWLDVDAVIYILFIVSVKKLK